MHQPQVDNSNSALDCAESRTVRSIDTRQAQRQRSRATCSYSGKTNCHNANMTCTATTRLSDSTSLGKCNFAIGNANSPVQATKVTIRSTIQSARLSDKARSPKLMSFIVLLPIICFVLLTHASSASGRALHAKKLILADHATVHRHRPRSIHSGSILCGDKKSMVEILRKQSAISFAKLKEYVNNFTIPRYNKAHESKLKSSIQANLNLKHKYASLMDRNFAKEVRNHNYTHLRNYTNFDQLLKGEFKDIYKTIRSLNTLIKRLFSEVEGELENVDEASYNGYKNMINYLDLSYNETLINKQLTDYVMKEQKIETEPFNEENISYNQTVSGKDWLIVVENISFFDYLTELYAVILEMCV